MATASLQTVAVMLVVAGDRTLTYVNVSHEHDTAPLLHLPAPLQILGSFPHPTELLT